MVQPPISETMCLEPSTAHIKYGRFIHIYCFGYEHKAKCEQLFFVSNYQIISYGLMTITLRCAGLAY